VTAGLAPPSLGGSTAGAAGRTETVSRSHSDLSPTRSVAWAQSGRGCDLLAIHGTLMTLEDMWLGPMPALARHFRVTAVDRPGHGLSRRERFVDASPWRQAALLHQAAGAIGLERPILLGHSFGGTVALAYAMLYPDDVGGVIALAPMCRPEPRLEQVLFGPRAVPGYGGLLTQVAGLASDPVLLPLLHRAIFLPQSMPAAIAEAFPFGLTDRRNAMVAEGEDAIALIPALMRMMAGYPTCRVPTHFLCGTADVVVNNAAQARPTAALMPEATFSWLPGLGHMIHHFAVDEIVEAAVALRDRVGP